MAKLCEAHCFSSQRYRLSYRPSSQERGPGGCPRHATYTDGKRFVCTQHAKEPATVMRKASGKIRLDFYPIPTEEEAEALCAADERRAEGR